MAKGTETGDDARARGGCAGRMALAAGIVGCIVPLTAAPAFAQAADFQNFFSAVCQGAPTGILALRCGETPGGGGALSGDSRASLNPAQALTASSLALSRARGQQEDVKRRLEDVREEEKKGQSAGSATWEEAITGRLSAFVNAKWERFDRDRDTAVHRERGYEGDTAGVQVGADFRASNALIVGAIVGVDKTWSDFDPDAPGNNFVPFPNEGATDATNYSFNLYASRTLGDSAYIDGSLGIAYGDYRFERTVVFQETNRAVPQTNVIAIGDTKGLQYSGSIGGGYDFSMGALSFGPYLRANFVRSTVDGYTEADVNNSGLAMAIGRDTATSLTSVVGAQLSYAHSTTWGVLVPQVRLEWEHEFRDDPRSVVARFVQDGGGNTFAVTTDSPDRNYYNLGVSMLFVLPGGVMPFIDYEVLLGYQDLQRSRVTAGLRLEF